MLLSGVELNASIRQLYRNSRETVQEIKSFYRDFVLHFLFKNNQLSIRH